MVDGGWQVWRLVRAWDRLRRLRRVLQRHQYYGLRDAQLVRLRTASQPSAVLTHRRSRSAHAATTCAAAVAATRSWNHAGACDSLHRQLLCLGNLSGTIGPFDWRHWSGMEAGLRSYLQCFEPDCTAMLQGYTDTSTMYSYNILVEAVVTDAAGNGSSTATVGRAAALSQESEAGLFKALAVTVEGPVTASAPHMVMVQVSPLTRPPSTAPPPEPEASPADPPMLADCDDPSMGRRRISSTSSHRRSLHIVCEGNPKRRIMQLIVAILVFPVPLAVALPLYHRIKQRGMQRNAQPAIEAVGDAA